MFELKQSEITKIIDKVYEEEESGIRFTVKNKLPCLEWVDYLCYCNEFDQDHVTLFDKGHFAELTGTPLATYRRWDVMQYFMSYDEQFEMTETGHASLLAKLMQSVYRNKPEGQVVVILAMESSHSYVSEAYLENYLGTGSSMNREPLEFISEQHNADNLVFIPVLADPEKAGENVSRLYSCMIECGMTRIVEDEYTPTEFVVITENLNLFTGKRPHPAVLQEFLSKGIRFIEYRYNTVFRYGMPLLNRKRSTGIMYFPTKDRYVKASGVTFRNYYVPGSISKENFRYTRPFNEIMGVIVPEEETVFPKNTMQQIIYTVIEQNTAGPKFANLCGYVMLFMSTESTAFDDYEPGMELDIPYGELDVVPSQIQPKDLKELLHKYEYRERQGHSTFDMPCMTRKYLFLHISRKADVERGKIKDLAHTLEAYGFHLVTMREHPNETGVYKDTKKFFD